MPPVVLILEKREGQSSRNNLLLQFRFPTIKDHRTSSAVAETASINFGKSRVPPIFPIKSIHASDLSDIYSDVIFMGTPTIVTEYSDASEDVKRRLASVKVCEELPKNSARKREGRGGCGRYMKFFMVVSCVRS